ncbi:ectoine/hydroxyectoine ABC transporter substrate-binding protein EhuB [Xylanibacillus composti]|nr:ectoine/hydroxyectoine ABC transporter substrate-binding protein EhuB [Xylanibacillus composti]
MMAVLTVALVFSLAACGGENPGNSPAANGANSGNGDGGNNAGGEAASGTLAEAQAAGVISVGFANEKPYAYLDEDNQLRGEAPDIARAVLAELGIDEIDSQLLEFGQLIGGLNASRYDIITAGMYVNPDRCAQVIFAEPEYRMGEAMAVKAGNPKDIRSYEDVAANPDVKIAVMTGAIEIQYLKDAGAADNQIVEVPDQPTAISALQSGQVDGVTMTYMSLMNMLESAGDDNLERVEDFEQPKDEDGNEIWGYGAAAFRPADTDLRDAYNEGLQQLKESGKLLEILLDNGFAEEHLPGDITTAELCGN